VIIPGYPCVADADIGQANVSLPHRSPGLPLSKAT